MLGVAKATNYIIKMIHRKLRMIKKLEARSMKNFLNEKFPMAQTTTG